MNKPLIVGLGEIVWDCLPQGRKLGGAPVNFAYHCARLGAESYPVSAVGKDALGEETLAACRSYGLDTSYIQRSELPTSRVLVSLDAAGVPCYEIVEGVAWDALSADPGVLDLVSRADAICWGSLAQRSEISRRSVQSVLAAAGPSCLKVFDINLRQHFYSRDVIESSLRFADILKLNEDELPVVASMFAFGPANPTDPADAIAGIIRLFGLKYLIYTCGAAFSEVWSPEGLISHMPTPAVEVVDTVGAGDSFTAAFVTCILAGKSPIEAHQKAVQVSAWICTRSGAINPLPSESVLK